MEFPVDEAGWTFVVAGVAGSETLQTAIRTEYLNEMNDAVESSGGFVHDKIEFQVLGYILTSGPRDPDTILHSTLDPETRDSFNALVNGRKGCPTRAIQE
ncbi:hypothetical protein WN55_05158 [Dufourea novaeangliae]|uniref:Uncharacterized protein n=1 Tax=Dufourea novaeangliae TaxID=178035 RepID=A0A154PNZ2_DUFNO|nr:hypothetical protein WN55_05158 [Dufourea novaeangliae]